ncbi:MAG: hypothetical protein K0U66_04800 [Gammaproteobacteria bacterium]|nr:hypothetical protein [Gammaproteobacteria bacterium]
MVNLVNIRRNSEGVPVALYAKGQTQYGTPIDTGVALHDASFGDLVNGETTLDFSQIEDGNPFTFTLDTHDGDGDVAGKTAYDELVRITTFTTHPHGEKSQTPSLAERVNGAFLSIANIFGRLESVEKALAMDTKPFHSWIVRKGREFQCEMENRENGIASVVLPNNYIAVSEKLNDDPNDTRELLRIKTSLGVLQIITARQELGAIQDALNADADEAVHSQAHLARMPETPEAG